MNERIKELADQARFVDTPEYPHQDVVFQKFAELIITKCVQLSNYNNYGIDAGRKIKEYFGLA